MFVDDGDGGAGHGGDFHHIHVIAVDAVGDRRVAEDIHGELLDVEVQCLGYAAQPYVDGLQGTASSAFPDFIGFPVELSPVGIIPGEG